MAKKAKLKTPDWVLEGYGSEAEYNKVRQKAEPLATSSKLGQSKGIKKKKVSGKVYRVRVCPKCGSDNVGVVLVGKEGKKADNWECHKCKWKGKNIEEEELGENAFLERMEKKEGK